MVFEFVNESEELWLIRQLTLNGDRAVAVIAHIESFDLVGQRPVIDANALCLIYRSEFSESEAGGVHSVLDAFLPSKRLQAFIIIIP
jgi:hypothetical protein